LVLDAGTGIRALGAALVAGDAPVAVELLLSHTHWDHIQGLPFFAPLYRPGARVAIRGPRPEGATLREVLEGLMRPAVFPIPVSAFAAEVGITEVAEGEFDAAGWRVRAFRLCHPGPTLGYRLERDGSASAAYLTDNELPGGWHGVTPDWRSRLVDFLRGVHTLVHDATNSEDQVHTRRGWGHSSPSQALALAVEAGCERLVLFHHDPERRDEAVEQLLAATRRQAAQVAPSLRVAAAREAEALTLEQDR
jgi:phosphoribosyl 1,2-cyclic phosphodiesterase